MATRKEREADPADSFDGGYHLHAEEQHKLRVSKNSDRIQYAIQQLEANGIEYVLKNDSTGHFHCRQKSTDKLFQFWAGTGKILGFDNLRGIHNLIKMLNR